MKRLFLSLAFIAGLLCLSNLQAQVTTNLNNNNVIESGGRFGKHSTTSVQYRLPAQDINALLAEERRIAAESSEGQPFKLAKPIAVGLDVAKDADWIVEGKYAYGKYTINASEALSLSVNFDQFNLPAGTEMYVYNEKGNMITGPVTEAENNAEKIWGSWVYKGEWLTVDIKTPAVTKDDLLLRIGNIAYGYKKIYETQVAAFGASASCHINVVCALGTGWENERNSVSLILNGNGSALCSGAMMMNTCGTNRPFLLTANHCFSANTNVGSWRFTFQAWSATCTPNQNSNGITFNGSTLRANSAATDFCLVELNNTPASNSGINYAGWSRNTAGITQTTLIHHPRGDIMKITRDNQAPGTASFLGANCWFLVTDQGTTEGGSSGCPYFDQDHRVIAQHYGINDGNLPVCQQVNKFGGRFDLSWTGGGTNSTRLSNWLDPGGLSSMTTNTTNISGLHAFVSNNYNLMSYDDNLDVGAEPNVQSANIWASNDIWNRRNATGSPDDHQEPGYSNPTLNNIMKLRIRNVGCQASPIAYAKMYWTMGSMGEVWQSDWDGTSQLCSVAASGEVTVPNGGQTYVAGSGFQVPGLQPNQTFVVEGKWKPKNPTTDYACMQPGMGPEPMICFLGRILSTGDPMANEVLGPIGPNVKNNNNIVTRNTKLINLPGTYLKTSPVSGTVLAHNYLDTRASFNIRFSAATRDDVRFGSIGTAVINLSDAMWAAWVRGGGVAEGMEVTNEERHEFVIRDLRSAVLGNIEMSAGESMNIATGFIMTQPIDTEEEYRFVMSQELSNASADDAPYGSNCVYVVIISDKEAEAAAAEQGGGDVTTVGTIGTTAGTMTIDRNRAAVNNANTNALVAKPNPATERVSLQFNLPQSGNVTITLSDANGRVIKNLVSGQTCNKGANQLSVNVSGVNPGTYIVTLNTPSGRQTTRLIINR